MFGILAGQTARLGNASLPSRKVASEFITWDACLTLAFRRHSLSLARREFQIAQLITTASDPTLLTEKHPLVEDQHVEIDATFTSEAIELICQGQEAI